MNTQKRLNGRNIQAMLLVAFISLSLYSYGTAMMDYFLVYPSRVLVGEAEFVAYSALLEERIIPVSVAPFGIITIFNIILLAWRPLFIPRLLLWISMVCLVLDWLSSIFIQIPINLKLGEGKDLVLIREIMVSNRGRIVLESLQALIVCALMFCAMYCKGIPRRS